MRWFCGLLVAAPMALLGTGQPVRAEVPNNVVTTQPETSVGAVLGNMSLRAAVVFVGQVESIDKTGHGGFVEVRFRVDRAVAGQVSNPYVLREWVGLWPAGQQRYRVGQRAMVFLHGANSAGISSPVGGMLGVVPLIPMGANVEPLLDVRWLATRVVRPVGSRITDADGGAIALSDALQVVLQRGRPEPIREPVKLPLPVGVRPVDMPVRTIGLIADRASKTGEAHDQR